MRDELAMNNKITLLNSHQISRRTFLRNVGLGLALTLPLASCQPVSAPAAAPAAGAAAAPAAAAMKLVLWHELPDDPTWKKLLDETSVEEVPITQGIRNQVLIADTAGTLPDLVLLSAIPDGADLYQRSILAPLDELVKQVDLALDDFPERARTANRVSRQARRPYIGELTGIPIAVQPVAALLNLDHFKSAGLDPNKPPTTGAELIDFAKRLTDEGGGLEQRSGFILGDKGFQPSQVFSILLAQWQAEQHAETKAAEWVLAALDTISSRNIPDPVEMFLSGRGSIFWTTFGEFRYVKEQAPIRQDPLHFTTALLPQIGERWATSAFMRSLSLVNKEGNGDRLVAGAKAIKYISDHSLDLFKSWRSLPPRESIKNALIKLQDPDDLALWNPFIESLFKPELMQYDQFVLKLVTNSLFIEQLNKVWAKELDATKAIENWNKNFSPPNRASLRSNLFATAQMRTISFSDPMLWTGLMQDGDFRVPGCCFLGLDWCC